MHTKTNPFRRGFIIKAAIAALAITMQPVAWADAFPSKPIRLIVPFPPGGQTDVMARLIAEKVSQAYQTPIIVENKPGANQMIGIMDMLRAPADGHTLLYAQGSIVQNSILYPEETRYDLFKDIQSIVHVADNAGYFVVSADVPANNMAEFAAWAKTQEDLAYASTGLGSGTHILGELIRQTFDLTMTHIPHRGETPAMLDIISGRVPCGFISGFTAQQQVKEGKLKVLGSSGKFQSLVFPDVKPLKDQGIPDAAQEGWVGIFGKKGIPQDVLQSLSVEINKAIKDEAVSQRMKDMALIPAGSTVEEFDQLVRRTYDGWKSVIEKTGVTVS